MAHIAEIAVLQLGRGTYQPLVALTPAQVLSGPGLAQHPYGALCGWHRFSETGKSKA